jgi:hypothetical protein
MRDRFLALINTSTGKFKNGFVQSLDTKEAAAAKEQAHRIALKLAAMMEDAESALASPNHAAEPVTINPHEIAEAVYRRLLADDEAERPNYCCGKPCTANVRYFAYFSPIFLTCSYSGSFRQA